MACRASRRRRDEKGHFRFEGRPEGPSSQIGSNYRVAEFESAAWVEDCTVAVGIWMRFRGPKLETPWTAATASLAEMQKSTRDPERCHRCHVCHMMAKLYTFPQPSASLSIPQPQFLSSATRCILASARIPRWAGATGRRPCG